MAPTQRPPRPGVLVALLVCLALVGCGARAPAPAPTPDPEAGRVARSQALLELQATRDDGPGCVGAVGERGAVRWQSARGLADLEAGARIDEHTTFELASVSKSVTALAVLLLEQDGRLSLDDHLARHLDGLPGWAARVTLRQLVHHTSGIAEYFPNLSKGDPTAALDRREVLRRITSHRELDFAPGSRWAYSNSNYVLLAEVVQRVSGVSYPDFLRTRVFEPLQLTMVASTGGSTPGLARSYAPTAAGFESGAWRFYAMGAIGVRATVGDVVRWGDEHRTGAVGGRPLLDAQWTDAPETGLEGSRYGPGLFRLTDGALYADGFWGGYRAGLLVSTDREREVVLLCNQTANVEPYDFVLGMARVWELR